MSARPAWEPLSAALGLLLLGGTVAWYILDVQTPPRAPVPGHRGAPFAALSAEMPQIAEFKQFYVNDDNPFVPWREREIETRRMQQPQTVVIKARPQVIIKPVPQPKLDYPKAAPGGGDLPKVVGFMHGSEGGEPAVLANLPGDPRTRRLKAGETVGRWTFVAIDAGNVAVFRDAAGREYRLVIGGR